MIAEATFPTRLRRFTLRRALSASLRGITLQVLDLSESGARVAHREPLVVGLEGTFQVTAAGSASGVPIRARVVWSRALRDGTFDTGLKFVDPRPDRAADLVDHLVRLGWAGRSGARGAKNKLLGNEGDLKSARQALDFLTKNRSASSRWRRLVERETASPNGYPIEILAAWELLGRSIDVEVVARAHREQSLVVLDAESLLAEEELAFALVEE